MFLVFGSMKLPHPGLLLLTQTWTFTCQGVPGAGWQTAYRSELFALAFVLHHPALRCFQVKVLSDCLGW